MPSHGAQWSWRAITKSLPAPRIATLPRSPINCRLNPRPSPGWLAREGEAADGSAGEAVIPGDRVAGDQADRLGRLARVAGADLPAAGGDVAGDPGDVAGEVAHRVEHVRAQHQHVLSAPAPVLLAGAAQLQERADQAVADPPAQLLELRQVDVLVGDRDLHPLRVGRGDHAVGGRQVGGHGLLAIDVAARVDRGHEQLLVAVDVARADSDDVQRFGGQHLPVVGIGIRGADFLPGRGPSGGVRVGHRHRLHAFDAPEAEVQAVAEIAAPGVPDRADAETHLGTHGAEYTLGPGKR